MKLDANIIQNLVPIYVALPDELFNNIINDTDLKKALKGSDKSEVVKHFLNNSSPYKGRQLGKPTTVWQRFIFFTQICATEYETLDKRLYDILTEISKIAETDNEILLQIKLKKYLENILNEFNPSIEESNFEMREPKIETISEDNKVKYIGYIKNERGFFNFYPIYEWTKDGKIILLEKWEREEKFPEKGNIFLYLGGWNSENQQSFEKQFNECQIKLFVLTFDLEELEDYYKPNGEINKTHKKLDCSSLENIEKKISFFSKNGLYPVVSRKDKKEFNNPSVEYDDFTISLEGEKVFIDSDTTRKYYGPYDIISRNNLHYAKINMSDGKGVIKAGFGDVYCIDYEYYDGGNYNDEIYFIQENSLRAEYEDLLDDRALLLSFINNQKNNAEFSISLEEIIPFIDSLNKSAFSSDLPEKIREERISRIKTILSKITESDSFNNDIIILIQTILFNNQNNENVERIIDLISKNSSALKAISDEISRRNEEKAELEADISRLKEQKEEYEQFDKDEFEEKKKELEEILSELNEKNEELKSIEEKYKLSASYDDLRKEVEYYIRRKKEEEEEYNKSKIKHERDMQELSNAKKEAEAEFEKLLEMQKEKTYSFAVDGYQKSIVNRLVKSAAEWETENNDKELETFSTIIINPESCQNVVDYSKEELIDYLCKSIKKYRPDYTNNQIKNILICIANNFLTIFSGNPGTGKTSICNIIAYVMGLNSLKIDGISKAYTDRFVSIAVERNWTSKRDFIGYYNPLTKTFDKSSSHIYDGLSILTHEGKKSIYPYFILLDEANLSPLEYYWSDFMGIADNDGYRDMKIDLGNGYVFNIPETLRFLATINNDHTTEPLSPRVIDRSWIISLPEAKNILNNISIDFDKIKNPIVTWKSFVEAFKNNSATDTFKNKEIIDGFYSKFESENIPISIRTKQQITDYIKVAQEIFDEDSVYTAIDYAVLQKLLPHINGCKTSFIDDLKEHCGSEGFPILPMSLKKLEQIKNRCGDMDYCSFF